MNLKLDADNPADREKLRRAVLDLVAGRKMPKAKGAWCAKFSRSLFLDRFSACLTSCRAIIASRLWLLHLVRAPCVLVPPPCDSAWQPCEARVVIYHHLKMYSTALRCRGRAGILSKSSRLRNGPTHCDCSWIVRPRIRARAATTPTVETVTY